MYLEQRFVRKTEIQTIICAWARLVCAHFHIVEHAEKLWFSAFTLKDIFAILYRDLLWKY
jgi:hypothetical protein